jgi:hypothetical protein
VANTQCSQGERSRNGSYMYPLKMLVVNAGYLMRDATQHKFRGLGGHMPPALDSIFCAFQNRCHSGAGGRGLRWTGVEDPAQPPPPFPATLLVGALGTEGFKAPA